ncbi:glycosyl hydrolase family 47 domain-containing protein [Ditylenchus destructor]|nr:glycosyl hydrolase family 47 domain-containing protein [Ditylenchus destructor]
MCICLRRQGGRDLPNGLWPPSLLLRENRGRHSENNHQGAVIGAPSFPIFEDPTNERQVAVRNAFKHAWNGYKDFAWGHDHLKPLTKGYAEWIECGLTIVDSLDTLIIMNLKEEFADAREWIIKELNFDKNRFVSLFETTIRVLGGFLSAYHLTGDKIFSEKAEDIGQRLIGALNTPSPIPYSDVNLQTKGGKQPGWNGDSSLSEVSSIQLEFRDLSRITGNQTYEKRTFAISEHIHSIGCKDGLCDMFISPADGKFIASTTITFGARSDSYYEYLLKQWLQTGKKIDWLMTDYSQAVSSMYEKLWRYSEPNKLSFIGELLGGQKYSPKMDHLVCFMAGTLALGAQNGIATQLHLEMAKNLSQTCYEMYKTPTGLGPEIVHFNMLPGVKNDITIKPLDAHSLLRPEAFEAWFYLYRITGDKQYQEWGWQAFQAIEKYAKLDVGYASVNNVKKIPVTHRDMMESFFLAESLKYLYLLFADDQTLIPLNKYVFNTEGHPLPIYSN